MNLSRLLLPIAFLLIQTSLFSQIDYGNSPEHGGFKKVNGIEMYYEVYGEGEPLILLHGNGGSIKTQKERIKYFSQYFKVIAVDSRAHGKSKDLPGNELTYREMAKDTKVLMDSLHVNNAYVWGQSDGGILALLLAIDYPEKVSKIATFGANAFPGEEAIYKELVDMVEDTLATTTNEHTRKLYKLLAYQPHITDAELNSIKCPVLLMAGDRDAIKTEHTLHIFQEIQKSNLFIMPGATHLGAYQKPDLFNKVLLDFFKKAYYGTSSVELFTGKKPSDS